MTIDRVPSLSLTGANGILEMARKATEANPMHLDIIDDPEDAAEYFGGQLEVCGLLIGGMHKDGITDTVRTMIEDTAANATTLHAESALHSSDIRQMPDLITHPYIGYLDVTIARKIMEMITYFRRPNNAHQRGMRDAAAHIRDMMNFPEDLLA